MGVEGGGGGGGCVYTFSMVCRLTSTDDHSLSLLHVILLHKMFFPTEGGGGGLLYGSLHGSLWYMYMCM